MSFVSHHIKAYRLNCKGTEIFIDVAQELGGMLIVILMTLPVRKLEGTRPPSVLLALRTLAPAPQG